MDKSNDGYLNAEEFVNFFRLLTRRQELYEIMKKYSNRLCLFSIFTTISPKVCQTTKSTIHGNDRHE